MKFLKVFFATLLAIVVSVVVIVAVLVGVITGGVMSLYTSQGVESESVLVIDLSEEIVDTPTLSPLSMIDVTSLKIKQNLTTLDAIRAIECAAVDDKIKGIYISPRAGSSSSLSTLEELRAEVERFKQSGKFVVAYSDIYSQGGYYLSSVADSLYLQPEGLVVWQGVASTPIFYKGLFDKLNINVEIFRPTSCLYKSAVEPLTRRNMSPENRAQSQSLVESLWGGVVADVARSRGVGEEALNAAASSLAGYLSSDALKAGLVTELIYDDEIEPIFESLGVKLNDKGRANRIKLSSYSTHQKLNNLSLPSSNKVAVIYAEGVIVDGKGEAGDIGGEALARVIRGVRGDEDVKAVVLRVNSPGGSALASDIIWREMELLRAQKPVVVSMGSYAASGGYYISAPADVIVASRSTITGSIGVYGVLIDTQEALSSKLGITSDVVKSNPSADFMRSSRPITQSERVIMMRSVDNVYDTFTSHVARGRNLSPMRVMDLSQGRVYSGEQAAEVGLVDMMGGLKSAIIVAADRGGVVGDFSIEELTTEEDFASMFTSLSAVVKGYMGESVEQYEKILDDLKPLYSKSGVVMHSPVRVEER